jgi:hypothetical protein
VIPQRSFFFVDKNARLVPHKNFVTPVAALRPKSLASFFKFFSFREVFFSVCGERTDARLNQ